MATLLASTTIDIHAPIDLVWSVMLDIKAYREWNPFIIDVEDAPEQVQLGSRFQLLVRWANGRTARSWETVTQLAPPAALDGAQPTALWAYTYAGWLARAGLVRARREQHVSQHPGEPTHYQTREIFQGALGSWIPLADVQDGFERHAQALKSRVEFLAASGHPQG